MLSAEQVQEFQDIIWDYYHKHGRDLAWRQPEPDGTFDPYKVMVSEVMLQQTQVLRVEPKYAEFLAAFPDVKHLADAPLESVLKVWQGLGYNRRARFLREAARQIVRDHNGRVPDAFDELCALNGIGKNTAAAILAYAFNQPVMFVETNIRTVYLHHFFADKDGVDDKDIVDLVSRTLDREHPREFYWAIMDYGTHLKATIGSQNMRSKHYVKQSGFQGSTRQLRGIVLRALSEKPCTTTSLRADLSDDRLDIVLDGLMREGLIQEIDGVLSIAA